MSRPTLFLSSSGCGQVPESKCSPAGFVTSWSGRTRGTFKWKVWRSKRLPKLLQRPSPNALTSRASSWRLMMARRSLSCQCWRCRSKRLFPAGVQLCAFGLRPAWIRKNTLRAARSRSVVFARAMCWRLHRRRGFWNMERTRSFAWSAGWRRIRRRGLWRMVEPKPAQVAVDCDKSAQRPTQAKGWLEWATP